MRKHDYGMSLRFNADGGRWLIHDYPSERAKYDMSDKHVVWQRPYAEDEDTGEYSEPADMRAEYERLTGKAEFMAQDEQPEPSVNVVELVGFGDISVMQPCRFGHLVEGHAVYCHNDRWLYAPRKCRRTWYTGGETRDEDCPGFQPNPRLQAEQRREAHDHGGLKHEHYVKPGEEHDHR